MVFRGDLRGFRMQEEGRVHPAVFQGEESAAFTSPAVERGIPAARREYPVPLPPSSRLRPPPPDWERLIRWCQVNLDSPLQPRDAAAVASTTRATEVRGKTVVTDSVGHTGPWRMVRAHLSPQ